MKTVINHLPFSEVPKIPRGRGIVNHLIASKKIGARNIHSGITFIPPKTSVPEHSHNTEEQVTIIKGALKIILNGDQEVICNSYDSTFISSKPTRPRSSILGWDTDSTNLSAIASASVFNGAGKNSLGAYLFSRTLPGSIRRPFS